MGPQVSLFTGTNSWYLGHPRSNFQPCAVVRLHCATSCSLKSRGWNISENSHFTKDFNI